MGRNQESYVIEGGTTGRERLRVLSAAMSPLTESFLDRLNITPGMRCLDVGCGGGDVTRLLVQRCGTSGTVIGIDRDSEVVAIARIESDASNRSIEYFVSDATTFTADEPFDVVYARFFLSHTTDARAAIKHLLTLLRPGGTLAVEDVWFPGHFTVPASNAFDTFVRWYRETAHHRGAEPDLGISLPVLFEEQGLKNIQFEMHTQAFGTGANKEVSLITLERIQHAVIEASLATPADVANVTEELRAFTMRADTVVSMAPVVQIRASTVL